VAGGWDEGCSGALANRVSRWSSLLVEWIDGVPFELHIPTRTGREAVSVEAGSAVIFVGANGGGKTRLAAFLEEQHGAQAHRIAAHRALGLNPNVPKISEAIALAGLRYGNPNPRARIEHRAGSRWANSAAVNLLNDFDYVTQVLFADQANVSLQTHQRARAGQLDGVVATKLEQLVGIWQELLPHRNLVATGDDIEVLIPNAGTRYNASELSDGERAIFYLIGQALVAEDHSLLIIDEPELHVHRSILAKLWDAIEAARSDCSFVYITHDLEFAASRAARSFVIDSYDPAPTWDVRAVPSDAGFDEETTTLILGSRRPILFVEGGATSLDVALYRCCYPDWTVLPRGSSEDVIHSVATMRSNADLTRVTCAGLVDADHYEPGDTRRLNELGVQLLPVAEIENVLMLPEVAKAIAESSGYRDNELTEVLERLVDEFVQHVQRPGAIDAAIGRYCRRQIDRVLKKIDLSDAESEADLAKVYAERTGNLDITALGAAVRERLRRAVADRNVPELLWLYDDKALVGLVGTRLKNLGAGRFREWRLRVLRNDAAPEVVAAIQRCLPPLRAE